MSYKESCTMITLSIKGYAMMLGNEVSDLVQKITKVLQRTCTMSLSIKGHAMMLGNEVSDLVQKITHTLQRILHDDHFIYKGTCYDVRE